MKKNTGALHIIELLHKKKKPKPDKKEILDKKTYVFTNYVGDVCDIKRSELGFTQLCHAVPDGSVASCFITECNYTRDG